MRQKGSDIDVSPSPLLIDRLGIVDNGDKPVSIVPEVEDHIPIDIIGIYEHAANFGKIPPSDRPDDRDPGFDLVCRIRIALNGSVEMLAGDDVHSHDATSHFVK